MQAELIQFHKLKEATILSEAAEIIQQGQKLLRNIYKV